MYTYIFKKLEQNDFADISCLLKTLCQGNWRSDLNRYKKYVTIWCKTLYNVMVSVACAPRAHSTCTLKSLQTEQMSESAHSQQRILNYQKNAYKNAYIGNY